MRHTSTRISLVYAVNGVFQRIRSFETRKKSVKHVDHPTYERTTKIADVDARRCEISDIPIPKGLK